jgi:hypothetical protein
MDPSMVEFFTPDVLNEQLAVVEHYLATTPNTTFTFRRREKLLEEKAALLKMLGRSMDDGGEGFKFESPSLQSPALSMQAGPSGSASISGLSTPDMFALENPFASVVEEPWVDDNARVLQEIA